MPIDSSKELALYLEKMRFLKGLSQEEFTDGIISNRQYQRYVRGESPMPYHLLDQFAERLNVKKEVILMEFELHEIKESQQVYDYYNAVINQEFDKAKHFRNNLDEDYFIVPENLFFFKYARLMESYLSKKVPFDFTKAELIKLINYPKVLNQIAFTLNEVIILSTLLDFVDSAEQEKISTKIGSFIQSPSLVWSGDQVISLNIIIFRLAKYYGVHEDYENVIKYCDLGLKINRKIFSYRNCEYYHYFLALSYYRMNNLDKFQESVISCYYYIMVQDNHQFRLEQFSKYMKDDFNIDFNSFVAEHLKNKPGQ